MLASIIEKETGKPEERTRVAAVFVNRLKQKMKLQSDPTIIYGLVGGKGTLGRPILRSEIEQPTPYNTYVIEACRRADRQSRPRLARSRRQSGAHQGTVFRRRRHRRARLLRQLRTAQKNVARLRVIEQQAATGRAARMPRPAPATHGARRRAARAPAQAPAAANGIASGRAESAGRRSRPMALSSMTGFARSHGVSRALRLGLGAEIGQRQRARAAAAAAAGLGRGRSAGARASAARAALARHGVRQR